VGVEVAFGGFITTFAVESKLIAWTQRQGATLAALFWGSIAVGRGLAIFVARCFKPPCMLVVDLVLMVAGAVVLCFTLHVSPVMLWVGTVTLGLGMSSIFPTAVSWADVYYPLTGRATAVFITGSGVGEMVIPVFTGYLFETFGSLYLMYVVLALSGLVVVVFIVLQCIASRNPLPTSAAKMCFSPLPREEENGVLGGMEDDDFEMDSMEERGRVNGSTGYTETSRRRQQQGKKFVEVAEEETANLVEWSD
jgi:FHS family Na+ dependent glucose MFS transporter 1